MALQRMLSGDPSKTATLYLLIGGISLVKAIALRKDSTRFRRELLDAGLFLGTGLVLRRYGRLKAEKREEMMERVPEWLLSEPEPGSVRERAKRRVVGEPEPEPSIRERARRAVASRQ